MGPLSVHRPGTPDQPQFIADFFAGVADPQRYTILVRDQQMDNAKARHDIVGAVGRIATLIKLLEDGYQIEGERGKKVLEALRRSVATLDQAVQPVVEGLK